MTQTEGVSLFVTLSRSEESTYTQLSVHIPRRLPGAVPLLGDLTESSEGEPIFFCRSPRSPESVNRVASGDLGRPLETALPQKDRATLHRLEF